MRKTLLLLPAALILGLAGASSYVAAQPQPRPGTAAPVRDLPRAQRPAATPEQLASRRAAACQGLHARAAGRLAELEVRLDLNANQRAAFNRWRDVQLAAAKRRADTCAANPVAQGRGGRGPAGANAQANRPSPVERLARQEQMLRQRLSDVQAQRPALEALYNSLTPEQRQKFTPLGGPGRGMGRGGMRPGMAMMRDRMGGGPRGGMMGRGGPMGRGGAGMAPPPQ